MLTVCGPCNVNLHQLCYKDGNAGDPNFGCLCAHPKEQHKTNFAPEANPYINPATGLPYHKQHMRTTTPYRRRFNSFAAGESMVNYPYDYEREPYVTHGAPASDLQELEQE